MSKVASLAAAGVAAIALAGGGLNAASINVDFNLGGAAGQSPNASAVIGPYAIAGWHNVINLNGTPDHWPIGTNPYNPTGNGTPMALLDDANQATTARLGFTNYGFSTLGGKAVYSPSYGAGGASDPGLDDQQQLYNGNVNSAPGSDYVHQVSLSDVPYATYDVYLLVKAVGANGYNDTGLGSVQIYTGSTVGTAVAGTKYYLKSADLTAVPAAGFSYVQGTSTDELNPTVGANYVVFSGLTSPFVTFEIVGISNSNSSGINFSGIQIVNAIPEPASLGAVLLGGGGLLARRRTPQ